MHKSNEKQHPTLPMPKDVDTFLVDCRRELEHAVEAHPYFADVFVPGLLNRERAKINKTTYRIRLDNKVRYGLEVNAEDVFATTMSRAVLAWHEGDRKAFSKYMAQTVAVLIRAWQLGLKTMHPAAK